MPHGEIRLPSGKTSVDALGANVTALADAPADAPPVWHALSSAAVLARLDATVSGLSNAEATQRLARVGPNALRVPPATSAWTILGAQLRSVVVALLAAAAVAAGLMGEWADAGAVGFVIVLNTAIGFATELRARRAMEALRGLEVPHATALRDGHVVDVSARDLVPLQQVPERPDAADR